MEMAPKVDMILVVGSTTSANSMRLTKISRDACGRSELLGTAADLNPDWFGNGSGIETVGVTAGASTPEFLVDEVVDRLVDISGGVAEVERPASRKREKVKPSGTVQRSS
jgi:4-hydroxy-3-methylbut-2-enyl diphosphate reductase